jgi:hypothetical protein
MLGGARTPASGNPSASIPVVRDDELAWCALGAGRMLRAPTVFEDVVNTT